MTKGSAPTGENFSDELRVGMRSKLLSNSRSVQDIDSDALAHDLDVAEVRKRTGLSQPEFAETFEFPVATLRQWEQKRRSPTGAARTLLMLIARSPKVVLALLSDAHPVV